MSKSPLELQRKKIEQLEQCLSHVWDSLSPELKQKRYLFEKFLNIQLRIRKINLKIEKDLENEASK